MRWFRLNVAMLLLACAAFVMISSDAWAGVLDAPRVAGTVGERYDGLAVSRPGASADVKALVAKTNAERRKVYDKRAKAEGVAATEVGKVYAIEIIRNAPRGTWIQAENGSWSKK